MIHSNSMAVTVKHWRAFGPAEWRHLSEGATGLTLGSLVPVAMFYATLQLWSFPAAVAVVLTWSTLIFTWHRRRSGQVDVFSASTFAFACFHAMVGLVSGDPITYLSMPSVENLVLGSVFLGSAILGRPLLALYARRLYPIPELVQRSDTFRRAFLVVSAVWFVGLGLRAVIRLWLLYSLPLEGYLVVNTIVGWTFQLCLVSVTVWYPIHELRRAGLLVSEPSIGNVEKAVEDATPGAP